MMKTVYRYEHAHDRTGPCRGEDGTAVWPGVDYMCDSHMGGNHPTWVSDEIRLTLLDRGEDWGEYVSGCPSRETIDRWFNGFHAQLRAAGFVLRRYRIPVERTVLGRSGLQLAFKRGRAKGEIVRWPDVFADAPNAESDFPEWTMAPGQEPCAFAHTTAAANGHQDAFCLPASFDPTKVHTYTTQWLPSSTSYFVDGTLIGVSTARTWGKPEVVELQFEPSNPAGSSLNDGDSGHVYIKSFEIDQYNGS